MKLKLKLITMVLVMTLSSLAIIPAVQAQQVDIQTPSDVLKDFSNQAVYFMPIGAIGMTMGAKDLTGFFQLSKSALVGMGLITALKYSITSTRPNGNPRSFPSGHAGITFISAEFLRKRYGWQYGLPAYIVAGVVSYERVKDLDHRMIDLWVGAAIGVGSSYFFTKTNPEWCAAPWCDGRTYGIRFARAF